MPLPTAGLLFRNEQDRVRLPTGAPWATSIAANATVLHAVYRRFESFVAYHLSLAYRLRSWFGTKQKRFESSNSDHASEAQQEVHVLGKDEVVSSRLTVGSIAVVTAQWLIGPHKPDFGVRLSRQQPIALSSSGRMPASQVGEQGSVPCGATMQH